jgi:hypothetical protein
MDIEIQWHTRAVNTNSMLLPLESCSMLQYTGAKKKASCDAMHWYHDDTGKWHAMIPASGVIWRISSEIRGFKLNISAAENQTGAEIFARR